ncbi:hypothetical protein Salat_1708300 [Sesamum alatum]|uniref:Uncharacterized protein n=1 Tax=Sesamum alatum TaxID=300844 RepID=A0AAE1Y849_9LAMI|nr:hypothetical protein Salat_1708300 [Sesamum alatum]
MSLAYEIPVLFPESPLFSCSNAYSGRSSTARLVEGLDNLRRLWRELGDLLVILSFLPGEIGPSRGARGASKKNILILSEVGKDDNPLSVDLSRCSFFVHIHDLPIRKMTRDMAKSIGNHMGRFIDMEHMDDHRHWSPTLRIRVQINVLDLLKDCDLRYEKDFEDPGDLTPYGPWLRAAPTNRRSTPASGANFGQGNLGSDKPYFSTRFPRSNQAKTVKKGMSIFNPTPSRPSGLPTENRHTNSSLASPIGMRQPPTRRDLSESNPIAIPPCAHPINPTHASNPSRNCPHLAAIPPCMLPPTPAIPPCMLPPTPTLCTCRFPNPLLLT